MYKRELREKRQSEREVNIKMKKKFSTITRDLREIFHNEICRLNNLCIFKFYCFNVFILNYTFLI